MSEAPPRQWRCKHCNERVDPTMALCWNCGHDRDGVAQPAMFVDEVDVDTSVCAACQYDLKGNPDASACPECGEPVPWEDCTACGVRSSRFVMAQGCPACQATAEGRAFTPEVERKQYPICSECQYDFRGRPGVTQCPECGASLDRERYETVAAPVVGKEKRVNPNRKQHLVWLTILLVMLPGTLLMVSIAIILSDTGSEEAGIVLVVLWGAALFFVIIQTLATSALASRADDVERRPL